VQLAGEVHSTLDGRSFDAAALFDFGAGGLRIEGGDASGHVYVVTASGQAAPACAAVGAPAPCLVPRVAELAHQRLFTASQLAASLVGGVELEARPLAKPVFGLGAAGAVSVLLGAALAAVWIAVVLPRYFGRAAMRTALGRVRLAARAAMRAARGDATLEPVRKQIRVLLARARQADVVRRACARKLARIDRGALDRRADALGRASGANVAGAAAALATLSAERAEAARLEGDHAAAVVELERIESALRVVTMRAGVRGLGSQAADPVDALAGELELREQAIAEAEGR
jgi:hypothetical protein